MHYQFVTNMVGIATYTSANWCLPSVVEMGPYPPLVEYINTSDTPSEHLKFKGTLPEITHKKSCSSYPLTDSTYYLRVWLSLFKWQLISHFLSLWHFILLPNEISNLQSHEFVHVADVLQLLALFAPYLILIT